MKYIWFVDLYMKNGTHVEAAVKSVHKDSNNVILENLGTNGNPDISWTIFSNRDFTSAIVAKIGEISYMNITPAGTVDD